MGDKTLYKILSIIILATLFLYAGLLFLAGINASTLLQSFVFLTGFVVVLWLIFSSAKKRVSSEISKSSSVLDEFTYLTDNSSKVEMIGFNREMGFNGINGSNNVSKNRLYLGGLAILIVVIFLLVDIIETRNRLKEVCNNIDTICNKFRGKL